MMPSTVNGTNLSAQEWCDALFLCYGIDPKFLSPYYDGCNAKFSIFRALYCNKGALITNRRNKLRDGVSDLTGKSFTPLYMRGNTCIHLGRAMREGKAQPVRSPHNNFLVTTENSEQKGHLLILKFWQRGTDSIHNIRIVSTKSLSQWNKSPEKCFQT